MKWLLKSPSFGDIVRVKCGGIYHYGIFVNPDEIIQFGFNPVIQKDIKVEEVKVLSTDVDMFLAGEFLEVGVPEKKERKKMRAPKDIVASAKARLNETGYHILRNNCEHFAFECATGEKFSSQLQSAKDSAKNIPFVDVYYSSLPLSFPKKLAKLPKDRLKEIKSCESEKVKLEKYFVWKLLEYALNTSFSINPKKLKFFKGENGKWKCDGYEFSLSHSHGALAVSVSKNPVGVDIEKITSPTSNRILQKIFSNDEMEKYLAIPEDEKPLFFTTKWTEKESIFKMNDKGGFLTENPKTFNSPVISKTVNIENNEYSLSVSANNLTFTRFFCIKNEKFTV